MTHTVILSYQGLGSVHYFQRRLISNILQGDTLQKDLKSFTDTRYNYLINSFRKQYFLAPRCYTFLSESEGIVYSVLVSESRTFPDQGLDQSELARIGLARGLGKSFSNPLRNIFTVIFNFLDNCMFYNALKLLKNSKTIKIGQKVSAIKQKSCKIQK